MNRILSVSVILGAMAFTLPAQAALTDNALTDNALTDNALTDNALTDNALGGNALGGNALEANASGLNLQLEGIILSTGETIAAR